MDVCTEKDEGSLNDMAKLRKMLCDINSQECIAMMKLIETQSKATLAAWAIGFAKEHYLPIYAKQCPEEAGLAEAVAACEKHLAGEILLKEIKPVIKVAQGIGRDAEGNPIAQAAARAVATACAVINTPTNSLGYLFYGAAAVAYDTAGLEESPEVYDVLASAEMKKALEDLQEKAVPDEPKPAKIKWGC